MEIFCGNSERLKPVDRFRRGAPSFMFDESSIVIEVIRTVFVYLFFFMKDILSVKNIKKHLSNIQLDIPKQKQASK